MTNEIIFFSNAPGLADAFPVVPASKLMPKWIKSAFENYKKRELNVEEYAPHITKCPAIVKLLSTGYIVPMWHDVILESKSVENELGWIIPDKSLADYLEGKPLFERHFDESVLNFIPRTRNQSNVLIKINTPWNVIAPNGVKLLFNPIPYPDDFIFEASTGLLDTTESSNINIQGWWNITHGRHYLNAGTPLLHIIPITHEPLKLVVRDATENDKKWIEKKKFLNSFSFDRTSTMKSIFKKSFLKHFKLGE